mmetsp:Transcript_37237/g.75100  ORF Transcript_37237/g.75100 Transcript_37237/m.75100 type:complete len:267 (-) Transcript_37237:63-863(-)
MKPLADVARLQGSPRTQLRPTAVLASPVAEKLVIWIRHGHSEHNAEQEAAVASGRNVNAAINHERFFDSPLSGTGRAQAEALGRQLRAADIELVVCSPLRRALQTALVAFPGRPLHVLEALRERHFGLPVDCRRGRAEIAAEVAEVSPGADLGGLEADDDPFPAKAKEHGAAAGARVQRALEWVMGRPERRIAVVTHGWFLQLGLFKPSRVPLLHFDPGEVRMDPAKAWRNCEARALVMRRKTDVGPGVAARPVAIPQLDIGLARL